MSDSVELLAPAGDFECLTAAFRFGADAVYVGGEMLQLRAEKAAFSRSDIGKACSYAHGLGKKLYVAVNSFVKSGELTALSEYSRFLSDVGVDAVIVSDIGAVSVIKTSAPSLHVHISTQANCCNSAAAEVYYNMGAERVVLARELSVDEIAELRAAAPKELELEAFVHGAMCMAYSGRCLLSSFMNARSGNRGECTQPCRWNYYLVEQKRPDEYFEIEENSGSASILSSHDLSCIDMLDELKNAGVNSFKIEGRMKTAYYVSTVVNAYRRKLDGFADSAALNRELSSVSHRPFSTGFYHGEVAKNHFNDGLYHSDCMFVGVVTGFADGGYEVCQRNMFSVGETLEVVSPRSVGGSFVVDAITDSKNREVDRAKLVGETVRVKTDFSLEIGDYLRRRKNESAV